MLKLCIPFPDSPSASTPSAPIRPSRPLARTQPRVETSSTQAGYCMPRSPESP